MSQALKVRAKNLRRGLSALLRVSVTHSQALELVAVEENYPSWDAACAAFGRPPAVPDQEHPAPKVGVKMQLEECERQLQLREEELREVEVSLDLTPIKLRETAFKSLKDCLLLIRASKGMPELVYLLSDAAHNLPQALMAEDLDQIKRYTILAVHGARKARAIDRIQSARA